MRLGLDTGGTFTDAVLLADAAPRVLAKAKSPTTHGALHEGLEAAARHVLAGHDPGDVRLVSVSTTLATNALAEGRGGRVGLVAIGFSARDLERANLAPALDGGPLVAIAGGHASSGREAAPLDLAALDAVLPLLETCGGVAVAGLFAVRDPGHERRAAERIREATGLPVTSSHELSARLNGPRRALTTVLNARLLPLVADLLDAVDRMLATLGVAAPVMIVRGDGGLMARDFARLRPVETILSGPAASLVGAAHLAGSRDALVCDVGGTTSDVGRLDAGRPRIAQEGARVSGWSTMVEAVAMDTFALGGDSEVGIDDALVAAITLGPRRAVPVSLAATMGDVHAVLDRQLAEDRPDALDGRFALRVGPVAGPILGEGAERDLLERMGGVMPLDRLLSGRSERAVLERLVARGHARLVAFTPSDALHVLGRQATWDAGAARKAALLWARRRDRTGRRLAGSAEAFAQDTLAATTRRMAECLLESAWNADGLRGAERVASPLVREALDGAGGTASVTLRLDRPVVGLGAAAAAFLPEAARMAGGEALIPEHADIANAIGAVVGEVSFTAEVVVGAQGAGYIVAGTMMHDEAEALAHALALAERGAREKAEAAGAGAVSVTSDLRVDAPVADGTRIFLGATAFARATGRPRPG